MATLRVVLDTNVLLSAIAYPGSVPGKILAAWRHGSIEVVLSPYILEELRRVLPRLSHRHGLTEAEIADLVDVLGILAEVIDPDTQMVTALRDSADQREHGRGGADPSCRQSRHRSPNATDRPMIVAGMKCALRRYLPRAHPDRLQPGVWRWAGCPAGRAPAHAPGLPRARVHPPHHAAHGRLVGRTAR